MKNYIKIFGVLMVLGFALFSCQEEYEPGDAGAKMLSGDWVVNYYLENDAGELVNSYGPYTVQIFNTSFDTDSLWLTHLYDESSQVKVGKLSETTFSVTNGVDVNGEIGGTIDISEAKVISGKNDSIIYRVVLKDAAGDVADDYYAAGHRYTGWPDDQH